MKVVKAYEEQARTGYDAAGAACRNAAAAIDEWYARVQEAIAQLPKVEWPRAVRALYHMDKAIEQLDKAADDLYRNGEGNA